MEEIRFGNHVHVPLLPNLRFS